MGNHAKLRHAATLVAENTFSTEVDGGTPQDSTGTKGIKLHGDFVLRLRGLTDVKVTLQRSDDLGVTFDDVTDNIGGPAQITVNGTYNFNEPCRDILYRFGVKTGDYGLNSDTVVGSLQQ